MARFCFVLLAAVTGIAMAHPQSSGGGHLGTCPPPRQEVSCRNYCQEERPGTIGQYYCCDFDTSADSHLGTCPKVRLQQYEIDIMCDPRDSNRPYSLNCKRDSDCLAWEKCCYTPYTQQRICRLANYE